MQIETSGDVRGWFRERLSAALGRHGMQTCEPTEVYLVELLARFAGPTGQGCIDRPLALQLADAVDAPATERLRIYRELGDTALYTLGFFEGHVERRGISRSYVVQMGNRGYSSAVTLAQVSPHELARRPVYRELADRFEGFVEVLDEVRESTQLRTPQDIVKLYERYKRTRSPKLAQRLREEGVFLQAPGDSGVFH